jgi:cyanophycin synthetase
MAQPGDLVVLTPTDVEAMWKQVLEFRNVPGGSYEVEIDMADKRPEAERFSA